MSIKMGHCRTVCAGTLAALLAAFSPVLRADEGPGALLQGGARVLEGVESLPEAGPSAPSPAAALALVSTRALPSAPAGTMIARLHPAVYGRVEIRLPGRRRRKTRTAVC